MNPIGTIYPPSGTHMPLLMKAVALTSGPVLEVGSGPFSTPLLHWACYPAKRRLVTYDNSERWIAAYRAFKTDFHEFRHVKDWTELDPSGPWSVVLVDQLPMGTRLDTARRFAHAEYVLIHDTNDRMWGRQRMHRTPPIWPLFKYRWDYKPAGRSGGSERGFFTPTTILSNTHDLTGFTIP